tara:strand:- start:6028 stop:8460 length:2433 start_codon:yes stop_codon:yes gene_type:complete
MVLQVGTKQFQSTAGQSSRSPVETFVEPVTVLPKTGLMGLAETLSDINPTLQKFVNFKIDQAKQEGVLEGQNLLLGADDKQITQIKKELSEKKGNRIMRNFVGGNMYIEYGIEKQLAMNLGNIAEGKTNQFFANHIVQVPNKEGGTTPVPLSQFDVNSKEFQNAINEFKETQLLDTKGIRPQLLNQFFFPQQNAALRKAITKQVEAKADANIQNYTSMLTDSSLLYFRNIDKYNENIENNIIDANFQDGESYALSLLQNDTDYTYRLGLSEVVSPSGMIEIIKKNGYRILNDFERGNISWVEAQSELDDYIDFMSGVTVGPTGTTKEGLPVQKTLGEFLDQDDSILELKKEIYEKIKDANKEEQDLANLLNKKDITETLGSMDWTSMNQATYVNNVKTLKALVARHKDLKQFIVQEYNLRNDNVDLWFDRFIRDYNNGKFGDKDKARVRLDSFMAVLGSTATDEDRTRYEKALKLINKESSQGVLSSYPEFETTLKNMKEALREDNKSGYTVVKVGYTNAFNDLSKRYRDKIDAWATTDYATQKEKDEAKKEIIEFVQLETIKIVKGDYIFENSLLQELYNLANPKSGVKNNQKLKNLRGLAEGGSVKKDEPVIVGEKGREVFVPKSDGVIIPNDDIEDTKQTAESLGIVGKEETNGIKRFETNFPIFYKLAKEAGHKFPELTAAQAMLETGNGESPSGKNNYLGLQASLSQIEKGQSTNLETKEDLGRGLENTRRDFVDFDDIRDQMKQYNEEWNEPFRDRKGIVSVDTVEEAIDLIQSRPNDLYATDKNYKTKVLQLIKDAKRNPPLF